MIYTDGLNPLFAFGGIYAAGTFGISFADLIKFGIGLNVTAGIGAFGSTWLDDRWGSKKVILVSLTALTFISFGLYALSGKATAFMGPMLVGGLTLMADSQRVGMSAILVFFIVGGVMLLMVPERRAKVA